MLKALPKLHGEDPGEVLCNFYKDLGWDGEAMVDPMKVLVSENDSHDFMDHIMGFAKNGEERVGLGFLCMNSGPSSRRDIPVGKVKLSAGWLCDEAI